VIGILFVIRNVDVLPENRTVLSWNFPFMIPWPVAGEFHKDVEVQRGADRFRVVKQAEDGTPVAEVCRKAGIAEATFYNWRKRYAELMPSEVKRLQQLEEENAKLKRIVADLSLDKAMLQDVLSKSSEACSQAVPCR
jgi:putative transposase